MKGEMEGGRDEGRDGGREGGEGSAYLVASSRYCSV